MSVFDRPVGHADFLMLPSSVERRYRFRGSVSAWLSYLNAKLPKGRSSVGPVNAVFDNLREWRETFLRDDVGTWGGG